MKDEQGVLLCFRCQRPVRVFDNENDKYSKMSKDEKAKRLEDQRQVGKLPSDIVEVYVRHKCTDC